MPPYTWFQEVCFILCSGSSRGTSSMEQFQCRYLHWSICHPCESSLLFYGLLTRVFQHFSFNECWHQRLSTHNVKRSILANLQMATFKQLGWDDPCSNLCAGWAAVTVGPHFFFNECWSCAPLSHTFKRSAFIYRALSSNKLDGTFPAAISTMVKLNLLCADTFFNLVIVAKAF